MPEISDKREKGTEKLGQCENRRLAGVEDGNQGREVVE
jgi:hypothetical protein